MIFGRWWKSTGKVTDEPAGTGKPSDELVTPAAPVPANAEAEAPSSPARQEEMEWALPQPSPGMPASMQNFLLREPVLDRQHAVMGYDFAFRHVDNEALSVADRQLADETLISALVQIDLHSFSGHRTTFIGLSATSLAGTWVNMLPCESVVLVIDVKGAELDAEFADRCRHYIEQGYALAFDDLPDEADAQELQGLACYLRFNLHGWDAQALSQRLASLHHLKNCPIIARDVGCEDDYQAASKMGFDAFQGYYFAQKSSGLPNHIDANRLRVMELLNLTAQHAEFAVLNDAIKHDVLLPYKLLAFINCPLNGLSRKIESIAQALMYLGYEPLYRWLTLLLFNDDASSPRDRALLQHALVRARLTETLGKQLLSAQAADQLFIVGVFSLLDVLLNTTMAQAIERLNLTEDVTRALLQRHGPYAPFLRLAIAFEQADQQQIEQLSDSLGLDARQLNQWHMDAINWASAIDTQVTAD